MKSIRETSRICASQQMQSWAIDEFKHKRMRCTAFSTIGLPEGYVRLSFSETPHIPKSNTIHVHQDKKDKDAYWKMNGSVI